MKTDRNNPQIAMIDALSVLGGVIRDSGYELEHLSDAAAALGQDRLANRLASIAQALNENFDHAHRAHGAAIHDNMMEAEQSTHNLMRGILAGVTLGAKEKTQ